MTLKWWEFHYLRAANLDTGRSRAVSGSFAAVGRLGTHNVHVIPFQTLARSTRRHGMNITRLDAHGPKTDGV